MGPRDPWHHDGHPGGLTLAIDTSTRVAGLAIAAGSRLLGEMSWVAGRNHTVHLLPQLSRLLAQCSEGSTEAHGQPTNTGATWGLGLIVVASGPGSFTGLRVGISLAKGLALAIGTPVVGVSALDAIAYQHASPALGAKTQVCALLDAGRGQLYAALYRRLGGCLRRVGDFVAADVEYLSHQIRRRTLFCGELTPDVAQALRQRLRGSAVLAAPAGSLCRAGFVAELGRWRLAQQGADDPAALDALYLRRASGEPQQLDRIT